MIWRPLVIRIAALLTVAWPSASAFGHPAAADESCDWEGTCTVELPGAQCADGTPMYMSVTERPGAKKLYIYLQGGGACWDAATCACAFGQCSGGLALFLSRPDPLTIRSGWRDAEKEGNPITADYNIVEIPYCTGDLFMGNKLQNFGDANFPIPLRQFGYHNMTVALEAIKARFPEPEHVAFMGSSAGGIGATFNLHQLRHVYPTTPVSLIADSGMPFKAPFIHQSGLDYVIDSWSLRDNIPSDYYILVPGPLDLAGVLNYNALRYPDHRYALISSYDDIIMNTFSLLVGTDYLLGPVHKIIDDVADHDLRSEQKVFFVGGNQHTFHNDPFDRVRSQGVDLGSWIRSMLDGSEGWVNLRPTYVAPAAAPAKAEAN